MKTEIKIENKIINQESPVFLIAEMSANHLMDYNRALEIIKAAKDSGADAIKLQTYTPDTITINSKKSYFQIREDTIWDGTTFHSLYQNAYTPWEWQPKLKKAAEELGLICFSSPFDLTAVDFMEEMDMPAYKIASFEITDIPLIEKVAKTGKPIFISTGIAALEDIERALQTCKKAGNENVILLKCTTAYPAPYQEANLKVISNMKETFSCQVGLSDHTMEIAVPIAAVALGAKVIEKHLTLSRKDGGCDAQFSLEPDEFKQLAKQIRVTEQALGTITYELTQKQKNSKKHARSLFIVEDIKQGEIFTEKNVRSIRPGYGLHTMYYKEILGKRAKMDVEKGTPMSWDLIE